MKTREKRLIALLGVVAAASALPTLRMLKQNPATVADSAGAASPRPDRLPRIDLDRLPQERPHLEAGRRDLFAFGPPPTPPPTPRPESTATPPPVAIVDPSLVLPTPAPVSRLPPLNLKYIGSVENGQGTRVAVLLTDKNELLTGQAGDVVANRYKIAKIGFESVDLEEVGTGQTKRIPLRSN
jgi:hypothetical protein